MTLKIYSKDGCEYCTLAKDFLRERLIEYEEIDMTDKDASDLKEKTRQKFFPFIFGDDESFIGGYFELLDMFEF
jgi:glutaredoxin